MAAKEDGVQIPILGPHQGASSVLELDKLIQSSPILSIHDFSLCCYQLFGEIINTVDSQCNPTRPTCTSTGWANAIPDVQPNNVELALWGNAVSGPTIWWQLEHHKCCWFQSQTTGILYLLGAWVTDQKIFCCSSPVPVGIYTPMSLIDHRAHDWITSICKHPFPLDEQLKITKRKNTWQVRSDHSSTAKAQIIAMSWIPTQNSADLLHKINVMNPLYWWY